jgi:predicted pyridoxine 5'-phosphate oxidase superfamily flavin-nucleotide-binding protein
MDRAFAELAFSPAVRALQSRLGSRAAYARLDDAPQRHDVLTPREAALIERIDGFCQATVSEDGWPYVQFRGGPPGFLQVLDETTLAYADRRGNRQYISAGNLQGNDRVALILIDHARRQRLKILGRARLLETGVNAPLLERLSVPGDATPVERLVLIGVEAYDWNCPQHIPPRYTEAEIAVASAPLHEEIARLKAALASARA